MSSFGSRAGFSCSSRIMSWKMVRSASAFSSIGDLPIRPGDCAALGEGGRVLPWDSGGSGDAAGGRPWDCTGSRDVAGALRDWASLGEMAENELVRMGPGNFAQSRGIEAGSGPLFRSRDRFEE